MLKNAFNYLSQASQLLVSGDQSHPLVGQTLEIGGRSYCVRSLLAEGGYALVFAVQDTQNGEWYALKRQLAVDRTACDAIVKEIRFLKQLTGHPAIIAFCHAAQLSPEKSSSSRNGSSHLAEFHVLTELCAGGSLITYLQKGPLTVEQVCKIFHAAASAVQHLHDRESPITHRDIKIENLLFDAHGFIKLCDFGSATTDIYRPSDEWNALMRSQLEEEMAKYTTPMYRAPEILETYQNYPIGPAQDIWALGCVLFYLCYRTHPFEDSAKLRILNAKYTLPAQSEYQIFHDLIRETLQPDPYSRPSIQDLCDRAGDLALALNVELRMPVLQPAQLESIIPRGYSASAQTTTARETGSSSSSTAAQQSGNASAFASQLKDQGFSLLKTLKEKTAAAGNLSEQFKSQLGFDSSASSPSSTPRESAARPKPPRPPVPPAIATRATQLTFEEPAEHGQHRLTHHQQKDRHRHKRNEETKGEEEATATRMPKGEAPNNDFFATLDWNATPASGAQKQHCLEQDAPANFWDVRADEKSSQSAVEPTKATPILVDPISQRAAPILDSYKTHMSTSTSPLLFASEPQRNQHNSDEPYSFFDELAQHRHSSSATDQQHAQQYAHSESSLLFDVQSSGVDLPPVQSSNKAPAQCSSGVDLLNLLDAELASGATSAQQMHRNASAPNFAVAGQQTGTANGNGGGGAGTADRILEEFLAKQLLGDAPGKTVEEQRPNYSRSNFAGAAPPDGGPAPPLNSKNASSRGSDFFDDLLSAQGFTSSAKQSNRTLADLTREQQAREMDPLSLKIRDWTGGKERNIRALLGSLSDVLWEDALSRWTQPTVADLFVADNIKKHYRKACLVVHPDKLTGSEHQPLAKAIFTELNDAWAEFQKMSSFAVPSPAPEGGATSTAANLDLSPPPQHKTLARSLSEVFPRQRNNTTASSSIALASTSDATTPDSAISSMSRSSSSAGGDYRQGAVEALLVASQLAANTRFAFTELVITVLRLDFHKKGDQESQDFCQRTMEMLFKWGELPPKTQQSLRIHMQEEPIHEHIAELIIAVKSDAKCGAVPLLGSFLLFTLLSQGDYDSRFRVLLRHIAALLGLHWDRFVEFEATLGDRLLDEYKESVENQRVRERKSRIKKYKRYAMIGAATGLGGVLIGVTGGLAAPLIVASVSTLTATTVLSGLTAAGAMAIFGSLFGAAGAGLSGYRMSKRVGDIEEFVVERLTEEQSQGLHCVLCVSGWIEDREEKAFRHHWRHLWMSKEQYTLRWESKYLEELGKSIDYFVSFVVSYAIQRSLMETILAGLVSAIAWPLVLLGSSSIIDNPWNICTRRASEVGEHLAEVLLTRAHGRRPITLIGFSLGARVIYHCLLEMSKRAPNSLGIVEDVILLGAPVSASPSQWHQLCSVVGGRVINGYCKSDWLLRFLYRTMSVQFQIAGTGPVDNRRERKIVNFNLSHIVKGHLDYAKKLTQVLNAVGVRCTPLSRGSRQDLAAQVVSEEKGLEEERVHADSALSSSGSAVSATTLLDEQPSLVVEHLNELSLATNGSADGNESISSCEEGDDELDDCGIGGLQFKDGRTNGKKRRDPLGALEVAEEMAEDRRSVDTFVSAISTFPPGKVLPGGAEKRGDDGT